MKRPQKRGPKPIAAELVRSHQIRVPVHEAELRAYREAAGDTPLAVWLRELAIRECVRVAKKRDHAGRGR